MDVNPHFAWEKKMEEYMNMDMEKIWDKVQSYGLNLLAAIVILIVGRIIVGIITSVIHRQMVKRSADETLTKFLVSMTRMGLMTFVVIAAIRQLGDQKSVV